MTRVVVPLLAAVAAAACFSLDPGLDEVSLWEAQLVPEDAYPGLAGQAAAVSRANGTTVGISIDGGESGAMHAWSLGVGDCANPVRQIGSDTDYPPLVVGDGGLAEAQTFLGVQLSLTGSYHVDVRLSAGDRSRVACGGLVEIERDSL